MGALHAGHADLLRRMRARMSGPGDRVVLSIFVNPTQFGPNEDLAKYPRTLEQDLEIAAREGVDAVFFPTPEQMYPAGYATYTEVQGLTFPLCGAFRPGHFRGVTTVVLKLFNLVEPDVAYFGLKDAQQFFVLLRMARDLDLRVSVEGVATVREADGLAMSSRNRYLSAAEREIAPALHRELAGLARELERASGSDSLASGAGRATKVAPGWELQIARDRLESLGFRVQYLEHLSLPNLDGSGAATAQSASGAASAQRSAPPSLIAAAVFLGTTRLIDNIILHPAELASLGIRTHQ
jgi:pantoate--beta-alanine ligase